MMSKCDTCGTFFFGWYNVSQVPQVARIKNLKARPNFWSSKLYQKNTFLETCPAGGYHKCGTYGKDVAH